MRGPDTIDEYISMYPENVQEMLQRLRKTVREAAPEAEEAISYRMPTFRLNGNLVHFAAFTHHIGFFPTSSGVAAFEKELSAYKTSTGTIRFPMDKPIPYSLVRRIVAYRRKENMEKGGKRTRR